MVAVHPVSDVVQAMRLLLLLLLCRPLCTSLITSRIFSSASDAAPLQPKSLGARRRRAVISFLSLDGSNSRYHTIPPPPAVLMDRRARSLMKCLELDGKYAHGTSETS